MHTDFLLKHLKFNLVTLKKGSKDSRSMQLSVRGIDNFRKFRKESVFVLMLFNTYINDTLFELKIKLILLTLRITYSICSSNLKSILEKIEYSSELAIACFEMKFNSIRGNVGRGEGEGQKKPPSWFFSYNSITFCVSPDILG